VTPVDRSLTDRMDVWRAQPDVMVRELFGVEPDPWQLDALQAFPTSPRIALQACTGPGKTAVLAWLGWNFMLTRPHPAIGATSISGDNLKANLWTELARWRSRSPLLENAFEKTEKKIFAKHHPETWKIEARTWAKDADADTIGKALKGLHADYVMWLLDETGDYPAVLLPTVEAIFSGSPKEAHIVQAGNPLSRTSVLFMACNRFRKDWFVIEITADPDDPKRTPRVSIDHAKKSIEQYGRENPWVRVNILGKFPLSDITALISEDEVRASMARYYRAHEIGTAPRVLSVDVAREGDDASVIFRRQGIQCFPLEKHRGVLGPQGAGRVARVWQDWNADACFIDMTGGWGTSWFDHLTQLGRAPIGVQYAGEAHNKARYYNKRAFCWRTSLSSRSA
jgi:phage terminase large subunit